MLVCSTDSIERAKDIILASKLVKRPAGLNGWKSKIEYVDLICGMDIETTGLPEIENSVMYLWGWCIGTTIITGRTWEQMKKLVEEINKVLPPNRHIVVWVHNLSFEFSFLKGVFKFDDSAIYALSPRRILRATLGNIEFRCSYELSSLSLDEFIRSEGARHHKLRGAINYECLRFPWTPLTKNEYKYLCYDLLGIVEAVSLKLSRNNDTLYTVPLTLSGYIDRDLKKAYYKIPYSKRQNILPSYPLYKLERQGMQGGYIKANRHYLNQSLTKCISFDRFGAYPAILYMNKFPISPFRRAIETVVPLRRIQELLDMGKALIFRVAIYGMKLKDVTSPFPFINRTKCKNVNGEKMDGSRIKSADYLETVFTDLDLELFLQIYRCDDILITDLYYSTYGHLPNSIRNIVMENFNQKIVLKGTESKEYLNAKEKTNTIGGKMQQEMIKIPLVFNESQNFIGYKEKYDEIAIYNKSCSKAFFPYHWGVWLTAWGRNELIKAAAPLGNRVKYVDTDCIKGNFTYEDFSPTIQAYEKKAQDFGMLGIDVNGQCHFGGGWEQDGTYRVLRILSEKQYGYVSSNDNRLTIHISGVNPIEGAKELSSRGGLASLSEGFIFNSSGGNDAIYNDNVDKWIDVEGRQLHITDNVYLKRRSVQIHKEIFDDEHLEDSQILDHATLLLQQRGIV